MTCSVRCAVRVVQYSEKPSTARAPRPLHTYTIIISGSRRRRRHVSMDHWTLKEVRHARQNCIRDARRALALCIPAQRCFNRHVHHHVRESASVLAGHLQEHVPHRAVVEIIVEQHHCAERGREAPRPLQRHPARKRRHCRTLAGAARDARRGRHQQPAHVRFDGTARVLPEARIERRRRFAAASSRRSAS